MLRPTINLIRGATLGLAAALLMTAGSASAAKGEPGPPEGKGEDSSAVNNLSFPVLFTGNAINVPAFVEQGAYELGGTYVGFDGTALCDAALADCNEAVFLQKDEANHWQAEWLDLLGEVPISHVDVADNLESVPWRTTSQVRVEFVPFAPNEDPTDPDDTVPLLTAFEMIWVGGQGVDEVWGAHATRTDAEAAWDAVTYLPDYATVYASCMGLSLSRLHGAAEDPDLEPDFSGTWNPTTHTWSGVAHTVKVEPMTAEINVKGRVIFGHNWSLKRTAMPPGVSKDGWWRLTFYPDCSTFFPFDYSAATLAYDPIAGPAEEEVVITEEDGGTGPLSYPRVPVIDYADTHEIVYIDVYIQASNVGGVGGGGGGGGGGGPPDDRGGGPPNG